jgi:hypothetical protein
VVYVPARRLLLEAATEDVLIHAARARRTDPGRVVGAKPAAFLGWMFALLQARRGDTLDDLFPGSGGVGRAWEVFQASGTAEDDASAGDGEDASLEDLEDASRRTAVRHDGSQEYSHDTSDGAGGDASSPGQYDGSYVAA